MLRYNKNILKGEKSSLLTSFPMSIRGLLKLQGCFVVDRVHEQVGKKVISWNSESYHISVSFGEDESERYRCIPTILINELKRNNENRVLFFPIETFRTLSFWLRRLMTSFKTQIIDSQKLQKTIEIDRGNAYLSRRKMFNEQRDHLLLIRLFAIILLCSVWEREKRRGKQREVLCGTQCKSNKRQIFAL